jgi:nucleoside-diphosphate-sugar epimerase
MRMRKAIITGANGFIGSRLVHQLLLNEWSVHAMVRSKSEISCRDRMIAALDDITGKPVERSILHDLHCHEADICDPGLGNSKSIFDQLSGDDAVLFHVAGDTRFNPSDPEAQHHFNVFGSLNVVQSLQKLLAYVVHVSTAYVAGNRQGLVLEGDLDKGQQFRNCYEKSKLDAEIAVTRTCCEISMPLTIVRPSIIINDTITGRSSTFTHLNALVEVVSRIQKHYGIHDGEAVSNEIRIPMAPDLRPNLAPVDPVVAAILEIGTNKQCTGKTFHLCHPDPQPNSVVLSLIAEAFGVRDKIRFPFVSAVPEHLTWTEKMMLRSLKPYLPYMNEACTFDLTNTKTAIPDYAGWFHPITLDYLRKVMEFERHQERKDNRI